MGSCRETEGDVRRRRRNRSHGARIAIILAGAVLVTTLGRLQVRGASGFEARARDNRLRPVPVKPARGTIFDRDGRVLAHDVPGHDIVLLPTPVDSFRPALERTAAVLGLGAAQVERTLDNRRRDPVRPVPVIRNATDHDVGRLEEHRFQVPEAILSRYPKRHYPVAGTTAHVLGYVGEISRAELAEEKFEGYRPGRRVGKTGVERSAEASVSGRPGVRYLLTDARGRFRGWLPDSAAVPPRPGEDLRVSLDLALQRDAAALFPERRHGAFVALDPSTGAILALYSHPTFDPNAFVDGLDPDGWRRLRNDPDRPMMNRAIAAVQPPASTWKPILAALALDAGVVKPTDTMPIPCRGGMMYAGRYYRCWGVHGEQDLLGALKVSCDAYFYQLGLRIGLDGYLEMLAVNEMAEPTGVDIPGERPGMFPTSRSWWRATLGYAPSDAEVLSLAIGQGPQGVTPLRLAQLYTAFARPDGTAVAPWLLESPAGAPSEPPFRVSPGTGRVMREALRSVVAPGGTAAASRLERWDFGGKTGTAQNPSGLDHAWFAGFGGPKGGEPAIVAVAFIENGEHGSDAARYVSNVVDRFLAKRYTPLSEPNAMETP